ncbi:MAG TPA: hypothetical protein VLC74_09550 [Rhizomicrobium sp.]|nr:hypothetical protein [Rhizomicrobium sp.]
MNGLNKIKVAALVASLAGAAALAGSGGAMAQTRYHGSYNGYRGSFHSGGGWHGTPRVAAGSHWRGMAWNRGWRGGWHGRYWRPGWRGGVAVGFYGYPYYYGYPNDYYYDGYSNPYAYDSCYDGYGDYDEDECSY